MTSHDFTVTVSDCSAEEAEQVMLERISYDEDYGFKYTIQFGSSPMTGAEFLAQLQEKAQHDFVAGLGWVDDASSIARALRALDEINGHPEGK